MKRQLFVVLAAAALVLAACGDDSSSNDTSSSADTSAATDTTATSSDTGDYGGGDTTTETTAATGAPASSEATVALATVGEVGEALVGPNGNTLYLFEMDDGTTSACTAGCAEVWPALTSYGTAAPTAGDGLDASLLSTAEGQVPNQVVYNGHLLYYFSGDEAPGDVNGLQIPSWYPVDAAGNAIDAD